MQQSGPANPGAVLCVCCVLPELIRLRSALASQMKLRQRVA
jgi:hypothetical protein